MTNYFRVLFYLHDLWRHPYLSQDGLVEYQNSRLRRIVRHAYDHVPFYHRKLSELGIRPTDIKTREDLNKLPIVSKNDIRKNVNEMVSDQYDLKQLKMQWTSGSTGQPLVFYISKQEDDFRKAKHLRGNMHCGQKPRDRWATITPPFRFATTTKLQKVLRFYSPIPVSVFDEPATQISKLERIRPDVLDGYSSSLLLIAKQLENREPRQIKPRFLFGGAELADDVSRDCIEKVFDAPFYDRYATVELERMAWQCPSKAEYHIDADNIILQFVDRNGEEVSAGESGDVICTSLFNYAMPFVRYGIGDIGRPSDGKCPCGRTFPMMKIVEGRKDSLIVLPDGRLLSPRTFTLAIRMFPMYEHIDSFKVVQKKPLLFEIYMSKKDDQISDETVEAELVKHIRNTLRFGDDTTFTVRFVDHIPLDKSGKLATVVSELKAN